MFDRTRLYGDNHKYFVDLRPRIFDVQIYPEICDPADPDYDEDHPCGWATILVGGMRFGGSPTTIDYDVDMMAMGCDAPDNRIFTSAYFILDITNPEKPPVLLGEYTKTFEDADGDGSRMMVRVRSGPRLHNGHFNHDTHED